MHSLFEKVGTVSLLISTANATRLGAVLAVAFLVGGPVTASRAEEPAGGKPMLVAEEPDGAKPRLVAEEPAGGKPAITAERREGALPIGAELPAGTVEMLGVDGEIHTIDGARGEHGTLVIFSCNACPWVKAWEERIAALGNTCAARGMGVIMINANDPARVAEDSYEVMQERAAERQLAFPYVVDATSDVARAFGASRTPEFFLFAADGTLAYHGALDDNAQHPDEVVNRYLESALDALLAGEPIAMPETKAMGCSIKFRKEA